MKKIRPKKKHYIFRFHENMMNLFQEYCEANSTTMTAEVRKFITNTVNEAYFSKKNNNE